MKTPLLAVLAVLVLTTASAWSQSDSVADAARQNQQKKASRVIDDENLGSTLANTGDVQSATATTEPEPEKDSKEESKVISELANRDQKAATPKGEVERQQAKKQKWLDTIEICKNKLANAQTDMQRDIWTENLASAEDGLSKTRKDLANAEQELQDYEQNHPSQPAPAAEQSGPQPEQSSTGTAPQ